MEERPLIDVSLAGLKQVFETYSRGRTKPESFRAIAMLASRLERELPDSEIRFCLTGFSVHVDSTEFAIRIEKTGPGRRWNVTDTPSEVFHMDERKAVRIWFMLRVVGDGVLQYCVNRKAGSPWHAADEAGTAALLTEAKRLWEGIETPKGSEESWRSGMIFGTF